MIYAEEHGILELPIDVVTDCFDVIELCTGERGCPQDRSQRLIILSLRERRLLRKIRHMMHIDTNDMPANRLTKYVPSDRALTRILESGTMKFEKPLHLRRCVPEPLIDYDESDLLRLNNHTSSASS